jgi:hypothetical protein
MISWSPRKKEQSQIHLVYEAYEMNTTNKYYQLPHPGIVWVPPKCCSGVLPRFACCPASNRPTRSLVPRALLWLSPQGIAVLTIHTQSMKLSNALDGLPYHVGGAHGKH